MHIKYTKSTQRQKRLVSSRKIAYKIFARSFSLFLPFALPSSLSQFFSRVLLFFISLLLRPPGGQKSLLLIFGTENAVVYLSLQWRERDARAITKFFFFFIRHSISSSLALLIFVSPSLWPSFLFVSSRHPLRLSFCFQHCCYFMSLKKAPNRGLLAR